jgi:uncharacterized RDD family membrane protein YckC
MSEFAPPDHNFVPPPPPPPVTYAAPAPALTAPGGYPAHAHPQTMSPAPRPNMSAVSAWGRLGAYLLEGILVVITLGVGWLIWAATIAGTGQTPAKRLLKHRVINADTLRPAGFAKMFFVRGLLGGIVAAFAIPFTIGILLFMPFWDKRNQNLWDKVSNTYVVHDPNDQWATKPDLR